MAADPERRARFRHEAQAVAALNHPNIVTLYSVEEAEGIHFITLELVKGQTLSRALPRNGFTLNRLLEIAIPLADAVSSAHRAGITHRDLKPDNVITGEGKILGTVAYMSPEQAEGKPVDPRSDVFSLGTVLYEMATGERPFKGETSISTIGSILKDEPVHVSQINRNLPRHLGRIIRRCPAKDPERRYQTAQDLRNDLEQLKSEVDSVEHDVGAAPARPGRRGGKGTGWYSLVFGGQFCGVIRDYGFSVGTRREVQPSFGTGSLSSSRGVTFHSASECLR
jgi:serine/threonine protein kinase